MRSRTWPDVDNPVGGVNGVLIVLNHNERVAEVPKFEQRIDESPVVALVQPDARLVEDVENAGETTADLGSESNTLSFPTRQAAGRATEG